jgi:hypothetical protein
MSPAERRINAVRKSLAALAKEIPAAATKAGQPLRVSANAKKPLVANNEILVVVMGPDGALVQRTTSPSGAVDLDELELRLLGAEAAVDAALAASAHAEIPALSRTEAALLEDAGLPEAGEGPGALERSQVAYQILVQTSLPLDRAAKALGVTTARLRQRLAARTLLGLKDGRSWRLPRFQFVGTKRLLPGIDTVVPQIRPDAHPLAVQAWFQSPHQDLVLGAGEEPVSPIQWLTSGNPPSVVAGLASEI